MFTQQILTQVEKLTELAEFGMIANAYTPLAEFGMIANAYTLLSDRAAILCHNPSQCDKDRY